MVFPPNWTSRISGLMAPDGSYKLSILKAADPEGSACDRYTFAYAGLAGVGHFDKGGVCHRALVKGPGTDTVGSLLKDPVAAGQDGPYRLNP